MTTFHSPTKYIAIAIVIILALIVMEILFIHMLQSPDPFMLSVDPDWKTLYVILAVLIPLGIVGVLVWLCYALLYKQPPGTYGTAHFATTRELYRAGVVKRHMFGVRLMRADKVENTEATQKQESAFMLGTYHQMEIALSEQQQEGHILIIAPTQRGKTAGIIIPNLLKEAGSRSLFVNDVKHELIDLCIGTVAQHHDCYVIAPTRPGESNRYNPLAHVVPESISDARNLAECIVRNTGSSKDPFWDNASRLLITAVILHLRTTEPQAAFSRIADLCTKNLLEISDIIIKSPSALAQRVGTSFVKNISVEPKLQSNIMTDMATRLFDMMDPDIEEMTAYDELDFERLGGKPSALFMHIPPHEASRLRWLSSCLIMQLINYLFEHPHKRQFAFYLDELANIGYIPKYLDYISYIRSAGVAFLQVVQDFGQLVRIYEEDGKDTILANSGTKVLLSGVGQVEAEYASRVMGDTTVLARSESEGNQGNVSYSETARKLMNPDEIRSLPMWTLLILMGHIPPFLTKNTPYFMQPELHALIKLPYTRLERTLPDLQRKPTAISSPTEEASPSFLSNQQRDGEDYMMEAGDPYDR